MSQYYGWTYVNQSKPASKRRVRPSRYVQSRTRTVKQNWLAQKMAGPQWPLLNKGTRVLITMALIVISIMVMFKEPALHALVINQVQTWWQQAPRADGAAATKQPHEQADAFRPTRQVPHKPMALIVDQGLFVLDCLGSVWPISHDQPVESLPVVTGIKVKEMPGHMGIILTCDLDRSVLQALLDQVYAEQLSEIRVRGRQLVIYTRDGIKIKLRADNQLDQQLQRLAVVLNDIRSKDKQIASVDMRYDQHIVVRQLGRR